MPCRVRNSRAIEVHIGQDRDHGLLRARVTRETSQLLTLGLGVWLQNWVRSERVDARLGRRKTLKRGKWRGEN